VDLTKISQDLMAVNLSEEIASIFNVQAGYPAFHFKRSEYSNDKPVCYVEYFMRGEMSFRDVFSPKLERPLLRE
ncbi:MAG: UTRA domain-containing protein, partial [Deltaproteobacteria bacterium]|nr:UTRA domain-containing protein [Deltaproteobacteria bacterium]